MKNKSLLGILLLFLLLALIIVVWLFLPGVFRSRSAGQLAETTPTPAQAAKSASVVVKGIAQDLYYVLDPTSQEEIDRTKTNDQLPLPPGTYTVRLNGIKQTVELSPGQNVVLESGTFTVSGTGKDMYYLYDESAENQLDFRKTNRLIELFPGTYTVMLYSIPQKVEVKAGGNVVCEAGTLAISGKDKGLYYVYDASGQKRLDFKGVDRDIELFPGTYVITIDDDRITTDVRANQTTTIHL